MRYNKGSNNTAIGSQIDASGTMSNLVAIGSNIKLTNANSGMIYTGSSQNTTFPLSNEFWLGQESGWYKLRVGAASLNASGGTYIYAAFAESPFKYANAR
jgi:hypothetical protein